MKAPLITETLKLKLHEREGKFTFKLHALVPHTLLQNLFDKLGFGLLEVHSQAVRPSEDTHITRSV